MLISRMSTPLECFGHRDTNLSILSRRFLEPYYHGYVLAATKQQRMKYASWLHVYAKKQTNVSVRLAGLQRRYIVSLLIHSVLLSTQVDVCCLLIGQS